MSQNDLLNINLGAIADSFFAISNFKLQNIYKMKKGFTIEVDSLIFSYRKVLGF